MITNLRPKRFPYIPEVTLTRLHPRRSYRHETEYCRRNDLTSDVCQPKLKL